MANFDIAYARVAKAEGGYQKSPNDSGNYNSIGQLVGTNWGISAKTYEGWVGYPPSESEMRNMPQATAKLIFESKFWNRIKGNDITDQPIADIFFDGVVQHGTWAIKAMQRLVGVADDGVMGAATLKAINAANAPWLYYAYKKKREEFYHALAENPQNAGFLNGWLKRLAKYSDYAAPIATGTVAALIFFFTGWWIWSQQRGKA